MDGETLAHIEENGVEGWLGRIQDELREGRYRPKTGALQALEKVRELGNRGHDFVFETDIRSFFDGLDREILMGLVEERISDRRVLKLIRKWLEAGVMEDGTVRETLAGTPQGGVISPLLANTYLNALDRVWEAEGASATCSGGRARKR